MRYFAVAEKSDQRKFAERLPDHGGLLGFVAEQVRPASDAGIIQAAARTPEQSALDAVEHARHVLGRAGFVAPAEHDLRTGPRHVADRHELVHRIDADEVAHQIVSGVGTRYRQTGKHIAAGLHEIFPLRFADVFLEYVERGTAIERDDYVLLAAGDGMPRADRRTALREPRRDHDIVREQHAGQSALGDAIGDLHDFAPRTGQPTGDKSAFHASGQIADQARQLRVARIAVHDGEVGRQPTQVQRLALEIRR